LAESIPVWKKQYPSISQVEVDDFHSLVAKSSDFPKDIQEGYIHPQTGDFWEQPSRKVPSLNGLMLYTALYFYMN
jgi:hypothetical protein